MYDFEYHNTYISQHATHKNWINVAVMTLLFQCDEQMRFITSSFWLGIWSDCLKLFLKHFPQNGMENKKIAIFFNLCDNNIAIILSNICIMVHILFKKKKKQSVVYTAEYSISCKPEHNQHNPILYMFFRMLTCKVETAQ